MAYQPIKTDVSGNTLIVDADTVATGTLAALNATVSIVLGGDSNYALEVQGTFVGTVQMERTIDGTTWRPVNGAIPGPLTIVQTLSAPGALVGYCGASAGLRVNMVAWTSGSATVTLRVGSGVGAVFQIAPTQAGTNIIGKVGIDQTTPGTTNAVSVTALPALPTGVNNIGSVNPDTTVAAVGLAALNAALQINLNGHGTVVMNVSGTFSATVTFQGLLPDGTWTSIYGYNGLDGGRIPALFSGAATLRFVASGLRAIRAILTAYTSGTATVSLEASYAQTPAPAPAVVIEGNTFADGTTSTQILGRTAGSGAASVSKVPIVDATGAWVMGTGTNTIGTVNPPAITKGTQAAVGLTTQDLKDAGRNMVHMYTLIPVLTTAVDTMQTLTITKGGTTLTATATPPVVTTGKTFRVTRLAGTYVSTATSGYAIIKLRFTLAGLVTAGGNVAAMLAVGNGAPTTVNATDSEEASIAEGWEFAAGTGVGISVLGLSGVTATAVGYVLVSITGFEY